MQFGEIVTAFSQKSLPNSEIELSGEVPMEAIAPYQDKALRAIAAHVELPGFRKGNVPPDIALKKVGEMAVLEEAVELFVRDFYPELITQKNIDAVGRPDIRINTLRPGNPVDLRISTAVYPAIRLPSNWKTVAQKVPAEKTADVSEEEVIQALQSLQKSRTKTDAEEKEIVPELDDVFARSVGAFETLDALKSSIRTGIGEEKARTARDKRRGAIIDALLEKTDMTVPRIFIESELEKIMARLKDDLTRFNIPLDDYFKRVGKTEDELRNDYRAQADKRAKLQLLLNKIGQEEKIEPDAGAVEEEMKHALAHFKDANPEPLRIHIETVLRNEKVLQMMEQKE